MLLLGFAGAFRRSELIALNIEDLEETPEGLLVTIRRGKADQDGLGRKVAIPRGAIACPVAALRAWLDAAAVREGALFRRVWNKRAQRVGAQKIRACACLRLSSPAFPRPLIAHRLAATGSTRSSSTASE